MRWEREEKRNDPRWRRLKTIQTECGFELPFLLVCQQRIWSEQPGAWTTLGHLASQQVVRACRLRLTRLVNWLHRHPRPHFNVPCREVLTVLHISRHLPPFVPTQCDKCQLVEPCNYERGSWANWMVLSTCCAGEGWWWWPCRRDTSKLEICLPSDR